jgi:hypothetical protein
LMANPHGIGGGSRKGRPNKVSTARVERAIKEGKKLPPEELLRNADNCRAMALRFHPMRTIAEGPNKGKLVENPGFNAEQYSHWLGMERAALMAAAPYYSPRLHAVAIATPPVSPTDQLERPDPRVQMFEQWLEMNRRGELAKDITPRKKEPVLLDVPDKGERKGNGPDPDDADGVAV